MNRRSFLASVVRPPAAAPAMTVRTGAHGEKVGLMGYGCMRWPTADGTSAREVNGDKIDQAQVNRLVDYALAHGIDYFDTAPVYCQGHSEKVTGIALSRHPRASYKVATKLSNFNAKLQTAEKSKEMYARSFEWLRTDYIDFYLLHSIGGGGKKSMELFNKRFIDNGMLDFLLKERAAGRIRNLGFSYHGDVKVFQHALSLHDRVHWDFVQIQMNYVDWRHAKDVNPRNENAEYLYGELVKRGIPVVVMEPLLGGRLTKFNYAAAQQMIRFNPETSAAEWALRFIGTHPGVLTILSGMTFLEHVEENVRSCSPLKPLTSDELAAIERAAVALLRDNTIPCNSCDYCMPCPYGLDIPGLLNCWNRAITEERLPVDPAARDHAAKRRAFLIDYERSIPKLRRAERCTGCGRCSPHCPQGIDVPAQIRRIDDFVETLRKEVVHA